MVYGVRQSRLSDTALKRHTAALFYRIFNQLSGDKIPENVGDFRLMDRKVIDAVLKLDEKNRFMKGIFSWVGFKTKAVQYHRAPRIAGTTNWNYWKLWNFALDGLISFSSLPLKVWTYIGAFISLFSFGYIANIIVRTLVYDNPVDGWSSLMVTILFFGGVQLISLGIIGEYLGRLFIESKNRPIYLIESVESVGDSAETNSIIQNSKADQMQDESESV
jgi:glycosyltransferase involved in cell wall biosynthesis